MAKDTNNKFKDFDSTPIFRYMDFSKFVNLLENKSLFFCNSNYFEDGYEGMIPASLLKRWLEIDYKSYNRRLKWLEKESKWVYINCWNEAKDESYALWKIYTNPDTGVAIKSTVGNLKKALNNDDIKIYKVNYIGSFSDTDEYYEPPYYSRIALNKEKGFMIKRPLHEVYKLKSYEYENEIRAIYMENLTSKGMNLDVDLSELIDAIYISPFAHEWFDKLIEKIKANKSYCISDKPIYKSEIILRKNNTHD